jgi:cell division protein FtsB
VSPACRAGGGKCAATHEFLDEAGDTESGARLESRVASPRISLVRFIKRLINALALPVIFLAVSGYFVWHAMHGERGLIAREQRIADIAAARAELARAEAERDAIERRVTGLRSERIDRDQLDERARALLNMAGRDEIVVPFPPDRRLY